MSDNIVAIILSIFGSVGFWQFVMARFNKKSAETELMIGLAHDRIYCLCEKYIDKGSITTDEYDNLKRIYDPYRKCGGNGTAKKLMEIVDDLFAKGGTQ